ncbi:MAG: NfeD family protein [Caldilineaceae bacterium]|nr:NfeD family protein [Caldilineaceae bacterium]
MTEYLVWVWVALALIFLIAELFTTGFFLICFGVGAAASAVLAFFNVDPFVQLFAFIVISGVAVLLTRPIARRFNERGQNFVGSDRVLGQTAIVLTPINPAEGSGMVRVKTEEWRAISESGQPIPKDVIVEVLRIDGTRLVVRPSQPQTLTK